MGRTGAAHGSDRGRPDDHVKIVRTIDEMRSAVRDARAAGSTIGFVPTMGAFHAGHLSLMQAARARTDFTVVSVFVNPAQFNDPSDLLNYPREEARDVALATAEQVDIFFAPSAADMYPNGYATYLTVPRLSEPLDGIFRGEGHFRGMATVVTKLFNIVAPDMAFFGQKDAQQATIVRQFVRDLNIPVRVVICPTVREADGLAMSSRNARLIPSDRTRATALRHALQVAEEAIASGSRDGARVAELARAAMHERGVDAEYVEVVSAETLRPVTPLAGELLIAVAAHLGPVRLIDNVMVSVPPL
jgi:pantoate--beta-alanine ligase